MATKTVPELRIRVKLYQNDLGETKGMWTYFLRVGENNPGLTFHAEHVWTERDQALRFAKTHSKKIMKAMKEIEPTMLWDVRAWAGEDAPKPKDKG